MKGRPRLKAPVVEGLRYVCISAGSKFYTVGQVYTAENRGGRTGFVGNDGLFDQAVNLSSRFELHESTERKSKGEKPTEVREGLPGFLIK